MDGEKIKGALLERALGYDADEVVEEYGFSEGEAVLVKRKVTRKRVPPRYSGGKNAAGQRAAAHFPFRRAVAEGEREASIIIEGGTDMTDFRRAVRRKDGAGGQRGFSAAAERAALFRKELGTEHELSGGKPVLHPERRGGDRGGRARAFTGSTAGCSTTSRPPSTRAAQNFRACDRRSLCAPRATRRGICAPPNFRRRSSAR